MSADWTGWDPRDAEPTKLTTGEALDMISRLARRVQELETALAQPCTCPARTLGGPITGRRVPTEPGAWDNVTIPPVVQHDYTGDTTERTER